MPLDYTADLEKVEQEYRRARRRRLMMILRAADAGMRHRDIAAILGVTRSAVSQLVRSARSRERQSG